MSSQILTFEDLKQVSLEEIIQQVVVQRKTLTIRVSADEEITIQLKAREALNDPEAISRSEARLIPLPVLKGYVLEGWKDAIYG